MRIYRNCLISLFAIASACAQAPDYFKQSLSGAFVEEVKSGPNSGVTSPLLNDAPGFSIDYGFRPRRWLMLEAEFDQIVRPIGSSVCCEYSTNANDQLFLVPFGARYMWDARSSRLRFTAGGGGAYINHFIGNQDGGVFGFSGWGGQFVASGDYAFTRSRRLRVGLIARYYFASPKPEMDFGPPGFSPHDTLHIFVIGPTVTFSFR
ncbi:MAG: hypothetical protein ABSF22_15790 [Bryobacteraceae bacterium]